MSHESQYLLFGSCTVALKILLVLVGYEQSSTRSAQRQIICLKAKFNEQWGRTHDPKNAQLVSALIFKCIALVFIFLV